MWSIESWAKLEEDFERAKQNQCEENLIKFDENVVYKTIFVLCEQRTEESKPERPTRRVSSEKTTTISRKRNSSEQSKTQSKKKKYRDQPNQKINRFHTFF